MEAVIGECYRIRKSINIFFFFFFFLHSGGVSVEPGQEIHILEGDADGWTKIKCNDIEGFVPSNYLEVIQEDPKGSFISTNVNLSLSRSHKTTLLTVLLDYTSVNPGELSMVVGDTIELLEQASTNSDHSGDWKLGKNLRTNEEGLFPFLFTQQLSSLSTPTTGLTYPSSSEKVKADYDFQPTSEGDLELHLGDIILVINKNTGSEGWWLGTNLNTQLSGLFPYSYTSTLEK
ncbi:hypothetical protein HMI56_005010 [Coelomomyces lativittatus]|nr:hypothetical protein HMI56_005010 [Coelomomyces lativittatus]